MTLSSARPCIPGKEIFLQPKNFLMNQSVIKMNIENKELIPQIAAALIQGGAQLYELTPKRESLENVFITLVNGEDQ